MKFHLKGFAETKEVYLENQLLTSEHPFGWGTTKNGSFQLAKAVLLKIKGSDAGYANFRENILSKLPKDEDFNIVFDMFSPHHIEAICNAMAHNKYLTKEFLMKKSKKELLAFVHPSDRETFKNI